MSVTVVYRSAADLKRAEYWYEEGPKLQIEVEKLRKVVEAFYYPRQALAELDKEGDGC